MIRRLHVLLFLLLCTALSVQAQGVKPLPTLHVEGKWLTDMHGNHVVLHGVMDTPSAWFNSGRWGWSYDDSGRQRCLNYFEKVFTGLEKAKCTVFRLHLEPAWTNDNNYTYAIAKDQPSTATGEADISHFNPTRLKNYLRTLYFPLAKRAMNHGMYVVVRPPGVCPHDLKVGDYYQQYLLQVWDIFTQNDSIRKYAGQISIELANEPVNLRDKNNQNSARALHDYFQPIVDKIRDNGFTGIVWAPGTGWQSNYQSYATYPIEGYNIGYAVHDYNGWYGCDDKNITNVTTATQNKINQFRNQVPVVTKAPVIITEVDWSPIKPGQGHYNEHGEWVESNYGTWATGTTSKWGRCFKGVLDYYKNISMTLSGTDCLIDVEQLLKDGTVSPAFGGLEEACGKACMDWYAEYYKVDWPHADDEMSSERAVTVEKLTMTGDSAVMMVGTDMPLQVVATFQTGRTEDVVARASYEVDDPSVVEVVGGKLRAIGQGHTRVTATFTDLLGNKVSTSFSVDVHFFLFGAQYVDAELVGTGVYNEKNHAMKPAADGQIGWHFPQGADMSGYKYLVVQLRQAQTCNAHLNIYTENNTEGSCYSSPKFGSDKQIVVDLSAVRYNSGDKLGQHLNRRHVCIVSFWGSGNGYMIVDDVYLTNNDDYSPQLSAIQTVGATEDPHGVSVYSLSGQLVLRAADSRQATGMLRPGIYIIGGKKVAVK